MGAQSNDGDLYSKTEEEEEKKTGGMTFYANCGIIPGITGGVRKAAKRHIVYMYSPCEIIIIIYTLISLNQSGANNVMNYYI